MKRYFQNLLKIFANVSFTKHLSIDNNVNFTDKDSAMDRTGDDIMPDDDDDASRSNDQRPTPLNTD